MDNKKLAAIMKDIEDDQGRLTPDAVVDVARDPNHPLHAEFDWNDKSAAAKHRLDQARTLIRSVTVTITTDQRIVQSIAYVRDPAIPQGQQGYKAVARLRISNDKRDAVVNEFSRAESHLRRARDLGVALGIDADDLEKLLDGLVRARESVTS